MSRKYQSKLEIERNMEVNKRLKCYQKMKISSKAFAIFILTVVNITQ